MKTILILGGLVGVCAGAVISSSTTCTAEISADESTTVNHPTECALALPESAKVKASAAAFSDSVDASVTVDSYYYSEPGNVFARSGSGEAAATTSARYTTAGAVRQGFIKYEFYVQAKGGEPGSEYSGVASASLGSIISLYVEAGSALGLPAGDSAVAHDPVPFALGVPFDVRLFSSAIAATQYTSGNDRVLSNVASSFAFGNFQIFEADGVTGVSVIEVGNEPTTVPEPRGLVIVASGISALLLARKFRIH